MKSYPSRLSEQLRGKAEEDPINALVGSAALLVFLTICFCVAVMFLALAVHVARWGFS